MAKGKSSQKKGQQKAQKKRQKKNQKSTKDVPNSTPPSGMTQERYDRLVAEAKAPFKGLRKFLYASFGASGAIGAFVFFTKILAGRDVAQSLPNLALQLGVVALMVFLFRWEDRNKEVN
ncbi:MAG: DUF3493 domain-containing protein [Cyanobacteria bacterium P01_F01_bin.53]